MRPTYPVQTERLHLRPYTVEDFAALASFYQNAEVARYLYWEPGDDTKLRDALNKKLEQHTLEKEGDVLTLALELPGKVVIGEVILKWLSREHRGGELGFVMHPDYQDKGYAREASQVMLKLGFEDLGLHRIIGRCDARNIASAKLMERLGMRLEAHFRQNEYFKGAWGDELVYALLRPEWHALTRGHRC